MTHRQVVSTAIVDRKLFLEVGGEREWVELLVTLSQLGFSSLPIFNYALLSPYNGLSPQNKNPAIFQAEFLTIVIYVNS